MIHTDQAAASASTAPVPGRPSLSLGAVSGLLAAALSLAVGHAVAAFLGAPASPLLAVGNTFIDLTPEWLKSFAIATFGEGDKSALVGGIAVTLAIIAIGIGMLSVARPRIAAIAIGVVGLVGASAALLRPAATPIDAIPSLIGSTAGVIALLVLHRALVSPAEDRMTWADASALAPASSRSRRRFLGAALGVGLLGVISGGLGLVLASRRATIAAGDAVTLPMPMDPAPDLPGGVDLGVPGVDPFVTPTDAFYRVDTALEIPVISVADWRLRIHGMVDREVELTFAELIELPTMERDITLTCVSNVVGGRYVGHARWLGVPLATVLELAGVQPGADQIVSTSIDGMTIGTPTAVATDGRDAMLAFGMDGAPLPPVHGYPVRMIVPGLYGYVSATKWLVDLELTTFAAFDPYWVRRGWAEQAPIKTMSRIDAPKPFARLAAGPVAIGGVAWAQGRGITRVEVRVDDGPWSEARLATVPSVDTWRQWVYPWDAAPGQHTLQVRATDGLGVIQTDARAEPFPDGATGQHAVVVTVT